MKLWLGLWKMQKYYLLLTKLTVNKGLNVHLFSSASPLPYDWNLPGAQ
jgi:hypothetical protein